MNLKFSCPHCTQSLEADQSVGGTIISCPTCQGTFEVAKPVPPVVVATVVRENAVPFSPPSYLSTTQLKAACYGGVVVVFFGAVFLSLIYTVDDTLIGALRNLGALPSLLAATFAWMLVFVLAYYPRKTVPWKPFLTENLMRALNVIIVFFFLKMLTAGNFGAIIGGAVYLIYISTRRSKKNSTVAPRT